MIEVLLSPGEVLTQLNASSSRMPATIQFTSNLRLHPRIGKRGTDYNTFVPLNGLLYFTGSAGVFMGKRFSQIAAHRDTCDIWTLSVDLYIWVALIEECS